MASILSVFQTAADGACGVGGQQRVTLWNRAAEAILGFGSREVMGRPCYEVFRGCDDTDHPVCRRDCPISRMVQRAKAAPTALLRVKRKDGIGLWLSVSTLAIPSRWNVDAALVHLFRDVSHAKTCETAVDQLLARVLPSVSAKGDDGSDQRVPPPSIACLTNREAEVLRLLAAGRSTREIAGELFVSQSTVRNHVHNILAKLDVHSRLDAVTTALRLGLL